jgi:hypothetical protein
MAEHHKYYKILREGMCHQGFQYALDISACIPGGMYFCRLQDIPWWLDLYEDNAFIAEVHFLPQSNVERIGLRKFRVDWCILRNSVPIPKFVKRYFEPQDLLRRSPFLIRYIEAPSLILQFYAVEEDPHSIEYIGTPHADVCDLAVQKNGLCIRYLRYHTLDLYKIAVAQNGLALVYVKEEFWTLAMYKEAIVELCLTAVSENGLALQFVRTQTEEICKAAVGQNGYALIYVKPEFKTPEVCRIAWKENSRTLDFATDAFQKFAGKRRFILH